jgi:hypothetical protein
VTRKKTSALSPATVPEHFLLLNDDVSAPLREGAAALGFVCELFDALAKATERSDDVALSMPSWEFLSEVLSEKYRMLDAALERVETMPSDLLLPHTEVLGMPRIHELYQVRREREEAAKAASTVGAR